MVTQIPAITALVHEQAVHARDALADATPIGDNDEDGHEHAADQWSVQDVGPFEAAVDNASDHVLFLLVPTRPHMIQGNPTLVFETEEGDVVFTPWVMHPGTQPNEDLLDTIADQTAEATAALEVFGGKTVAKMATAINALSRTW